ncbi:MAG: FAD-linked oxidoreductase [Maribacter sp.]|jgi:FAD-linked oxidoreductase
MSENTWKNWSETVVCNPDQILMPSSEEEITSIIQAAAKNGKTIRMVGKGHSFTGLVGTDSIIMALDNWGGLINVEGQVATVKAGSNIKLLGEELYQNGLAQENLGDIDIQSIAGAVSTGTHGTGVQFGNLATQVEEITFINARGEKITCSESQNHDIFKAAQVSLGSMGVITRMKIRCLPKYILELKNVKADFKDTLAKLDQYNKENRNFEFYYFPYTETVQLKISNVTEAEPKEGGVLQYINDMVLENGAFKLFSEISRIIPSQSRNVSKLVGACVGESKRNTWSHRVYATSRLVRFTEMEYNIPEDAFEECILEIKKKIEDTRYDLHFPIECRFVKGDDIWLSPAYQRNSAYIAVHMYKGMPYKQYLDDMEAIFKKYDGRPHWGKLHYQTSDSLSKLYPKWDDFHAIRKEMDPNGMFLNQYLKDIFGE